MASPPVIVNHSVVRAGASTRASAAGLAAYAGTRRGVVIEVSEADGRRLGVDGLAAYAANRTGSTGGLWGADGPVPVAEARRAIAQNGGAVLTTVVTVPNEIAPGAGLDRLDAWQALVRSEWPRLFSEMTGVPESRVEFYAAIHGTTPPPPPLTAPPNPARPPLLPRGKMEAARLEISSKAMAPLLREAYIERDLARKAALEAVARIDRGKLDIGLPPNGSLSDPESFPGSPASGKRKNRGRPPQAFPPGGLRRVEGGPRPGGVRLPRTRRRTGAPQEGGREVRRPQVPDR